MVERPDISDVALWCDRCKRLSARGGPMTDTEGTTPKARPGDCGPVSRAPGGHSTPDVGQARPVAKP